MSGLLSDLLTTSIAKHARTLTQNHYFNGHPDLVVRGAYPKDSVKAGSEGVEIKTTRKSGGAVDTHGARDQWMAVFVYDVDTTTEPARERRAMTFREIYIGKVEIADFRKNPRGELGTRTGTLHREGNLTCEAKSRPIFPGITTLLSSLVPPLARSTRRKHHAFFR